MSGTELMRPAGLTHDHRTHDTDILNYIVAYVYYVF